MNNKKFIIVKTLDIFAYSSLVLFFVLAVFIKTNNEFNAYLGSFLVESILSLAIFAYLIRSLLKKVIYFFGYAYKCNDNQSYYYLLMVFVFTINMFLLFKAYKNYCLYSNI